MPYTNRGKFILFQSFYQDVAEPLNFFVALLGDSVTPNADTNILTDVAEVPAGNGYTAGGISVARDVTDFDVITENDAADRVELQIIDMVWTASGGTLPASGTGARWAVLLGPHATPGSREVLVWWDLTSLRQVSDGQTLTLVNLELRGIHVA